jgi:hypothetical protein
MERFTVFRDIAIGLSSILIGVTVVENLTNTGCDRRRRPAHVDPLIEHFRHGPQVILVTSDDDLSDTLVRVVEREHKLVAAIGEIEHAAVHLV